MLEFFSRLSAEWKSLGELGKLPPAERDIFFYAESAADWPHFEAMVRELTLTHGRNIAYVTSDWCDPILKGGRLDEAARAFIKPFYIGSGTARTLFFKGMSCRVCVITLPELDKYQLKRSTHPVHYLYVYHSINSTHMVYRKGAFDGYDTVLCVGPHHTDEIRKTEEVYKLKPKLLVNHGYARLDAIYAAQTATRAAYRPAEGAAKRVLLAPSWGTCSFIEGPWGRPLVRHLLDAGHQVAVRLHPMTVRHHPNLAGALEKEFGSAGERFKVITDMSESESLAKADLMMSDWSGASFEFAFGLERPVLFVNTPAKVNNPEWERLGLPSLEASIRTEIGEIIETTDLQSVAARVERLTRDPAAFVERLRSARGRWIYNLGKSGAVGANEVLKVLAAPARAREAGRDPVMGRELNP